MTAAARVDRQFRPAERNVGFMGALSLAKETAHAPPMDIA